MRVHIDNELVCRKCIISLCCLTESNSKPHINTNTTFFTVDNEKMSFKELGDIGLLLQVMNRYVNDISVCKSSLIVLCHIFEIDESTRREAYEKGCLTTLFNIKNKHSEDEELCKLCNVLIALILHHKTYESINN